MFSGLYQVFLNPIYGVFARSFVETCLMIWLRHDAKALDKPIETLHGIASQNILGSRALMLSHVMEAIEDVLRPRIPTRLAHPLVYRS